MIIDQPDSFAFILESKQFSFTSAAVPRNSQLMLFPHSVRCHISHKPENLVKICKGLGRANGSKTSHSSSVF